MLERSFPLNSKNIIQESYLGIQEAFRPNRISFLLLLIEAALLKLLHKKNEAQLGGWQAFFSNEKDKKPKKQIDKYLIYISVLYAVFGAPLIEEILYRGILTSTLEKVFPKININSSYASIVSSVLFGCSHPNGQKLASIYFGIQQEKFTKINNGSLWGSIAKHSANNITAIIPPQLIALIGLGIAIMKLNDEVKKLKEANEDLTLTPNIPSKALSAAMDGAKLGATTALWLIPLIIQSQITKNKNFTTCFKGSLTQSAISVAAGASIGAALSASLRARICLFSNKPKNESKLIVEDNMQRKTLS